MRLVLLTHPAFVGSQSMPRFARMLAATLTDRGHVVEVWTCDAHAYNIVGGPRLKKWTGYIDQYLIFPIVLRRRIGAQPPNTLYVFCDQALGPWMGLCRSRPHVVHAHDLLALRSALGLVPENPTSWTGRLYQRFIRRGFARARNFISVSNQTRQDLLRYGGVRPDCSEVVFNGMNFPYAPLAPERARDIVLGAGLPPFDRGVIIHVGGNQWYKNTAGVLSIYAEYARRRQHPVPLLMVSHPPSSAAAKAALACIPPHGEVRFVKGIASEVLQALYSRANCLLFPSLEEGFGWPIIEAQACGCPVITTDSPPMNEIGGPAARYLPRYQLEDDLAQWSRHGADVLESVLDLDTAARATLSAEAIEWAGQFGADRAIDGYLRIYEQVLERESSQPGRRFGDGP